MIVKLKFITTALLLLGPVSASADGLGLAIGGNYGSKEGCVYAKTGESSGADDFILLTPDALTTSVFACDFKKIVKKGADGFTVAGSCQADGEDGDQEQKIQISRVDKNSYRVSFDDGTKLGPIKKCP